MGGGRIWGEVGTPSHPLSIYGHEVYTQRGILSLELMNGEEGRGSCQSVYKEREGKSLMWNPQQANTYRGAETKRNTVNCFFFPVFDHRPLWIICWIPSKGGLKENKLLYYLFTPSLFFLTFFISFPGRDGLLSASVCWTIWIWMRKILSTLSLRIATVLPWGWKTACGKITRRCMSMQSGEYLPSLATVSSHVCTVDESACMTV